MAVLRTTTVVKERREDFMVIFWVGLSFPLELGRVSQLASQLVTWYQF